MKRWPFMLRRTHERQCRALRITIDEEHCKRDRAELDRSTYIGKLFALREHVEKVADDLEMGRRSRMSAASYLRDAVVTVYGKESGPLVR